MRVPFFAIEKAPQPKGTGRSTLHWRIHKHIARASFAKIGISPDLFRMLSRVTLQLLWGRRDLSADLQGNVLAGIFFVCYVEAKRMPLAWPPAYFTDLLARLGLQVNVYYRCPSV